MHVGAGIAALEPLGQCREGLQRAQCAAFRIVGKGDHGRIKFIDHISVLSVGVKGKMSRPGPGVRLDLDPIFDRVNVSQRPFYGRVFASDLLQSLGIDPPARIKGVAQSGGKGVCVHRHTIGSHALTQTVGDAVAEPLGGGFESDLCGCLALLPCCFL